MTETPILLPFATSSDTQTTNPPVSSSPTPAHSSTQIPIPIPSEPIQTQISPIISRNFSNQTPEYLVALDREIYHTNPVPLNSAPPLNPPQGESEVTLSDLSSMKSSDFMISDPHTLPKSHTIRALTPSPNPSIYDFQGPSTLSEKYFSNPASPEATNIQSSSSLTVTDPLSTIIISQPKPFHPLKSINSFFEAASKNELMLLRG